MPAPALPPAISLQTLREDLVYSHAILAANNEAASHAKVFTQLLAAWEKVQATQLAHWDAEAHADALIAAADDALDDFIVAFAARLDEVVGGKGTKSATRDLYFKVAPYELASPVLGEELDAMRRWQKLLGKEKEPKLASMKKTLDARVKDADAAVKARDEARSNNAHFRATGDLAAFLTSVRQKRDTVAAALDAMAAADDSLPRRFSSRFFRHRVTRVSAEEKQAKKAKKDAERQAKADAKQKVLEAQVQLKAALKGLRTAKA